jgi:hypothetical protein
MHLLKMPTMQRQRTYRHDVFSGWQLAGQKWTVLKNIYFPSAVILPQVSQDFKLWLWRWAIRRAVQQCASGF